MDVVNAGITPDAGTQTSGGGGEAGNVSELVAKIAALEAQNVQLSKDLNEQRNIQAGLDRTLSQREKALSELTTQLDHYKTIGSGDAQALADALAQVTTLTGRVSELEGLQSQLDQVRTVNNRMRVLMETHPELSYLAANDALPAADSDEEFKQKLDRIAGAGSTAAAAQAQTLLAGGRPPTQPPMGQGDQDPKSLFRQGTQLIEAGKIEEGNRVLDQYWGLVSKKTN